MAISFIGDGVTGAAANGGNITLDLSNVAGGAGMAIGDFMVIAHVIPETATDYVAAFMGNHGWTILADLFANDTQDTNLHVYGKFVHNVALDEIVQLWGNGGGLTEGNSAAAMVFRGVDLTRPLDAAPVTTTAINTVLADPSAITPVTTGAWTVIAVGGSHQGGAATFTAPTNYTTDAVSIGSNDSNDSSVLLAYNDAPSIGSAENPGAVTFSTTDSVNYSNAACTLALRPAGTETGITVVGVRTATSINGGDGTVTLPTTLEDDVVISAYTTNDTANTDLGMNTADYTEIADLYADDTVDTNLGVFRKVQGASPDTTAVFDGSGVTSQSIAAVSLVLRGVDTTTPEDVASVTATGTNTARANPGSINFASANVLIVIVVGAGLTDPEKGHLFNYPYFGAGINEDVETNNNSVGIAWAPYELVSDPEDPAVVNNTGYSTGSPGSADVTTESWAAVTMAMRQGAAAAGALQPVVIVVGL